MSYLTSRWRSLAVTETHAWALLVALASLLVSVTAQAAPCARYATVRRGTVGPAWHSYLHCEAEADRPTINAEGDIAHSMAEGSLCVWTLGAWACLAGGGGGGAPVGASYWTRVAEGGLSNETALGALGAGLLVNTPTTGAPTVYAGSSCGSGKAISLGASGALACSLVADADVSSGAAIAESKLALAFPTHSAANDPTSGEKAALAGSSGAPGAGNRYVTDADARNTDARTPTAHGHVEADVTGLVSDLAGKVPAARAINTTAPLAGGGDLTADRTLTVATFGSGASGVVPASGGGTANFLRADGTWAAPAGGGGGANAVGVGVDFGSGKTAASTTVTGQAWVTASSKIVCAPSSEDGVLEGLVGAVVTRDAGVGFTLEAGPRLGLAVGVHAFFCLGV